MSGYRVKPGWLLPDDLDPEETICYQITIPNTPQYRWAFWACLDTLTWYTAWEKDELKRAKDAAKVWQGYIEAAKESNGCMDTGDLNLHFEDCTLQLRLEETVLSSVDLSLVECEALQGPPGPAGAPGAVGPPGPAGESGEINDYAPPPDAGSSGLCNAVEYVADELLAIITDVITDAETLTFEEIIKTNLIGGGWSESPLKQFLNWVFTNILEPNLITRAGDIIQDARQALYCASFDKAEFKRQMEGSDIADTVARDAWIGAFDSVADGTVSLWVAIGREGTGADCSAYDCVPPVDPCWDYRIAQYDSSGSGAVAPVWVQGVGWRQINTAGAYAINNMRQPTAGGGHIHIQKLTTVIVTNFPIQLRVIRARNGFTSRRLIDDLPLGPGTHTAVWEGDDWAREISFIIENGAHDSGQTVTIQSLCLELFDT